MADMKVVFFTNLDPESRQRVVDHALPGMNVVAAPIAMDDDGKIALVKAADFIILFPGRISDRVLLAARKCRLVQLPTGVIINTSRGGVIEETALVEALLTRAIAAAGLDVMEHEPPDPGDPLLQLENAVITPHTAGPTLESIPKRAANAFHNIQRVWNGEPPLWTPEYENP